MEDDKIVVNSGNDCQDGINHNLGSFPQRERKRDLGSVQKNNDGQVDFSRFDKTKKKKKTVVTSSFGQKINLLLRKNKTFYLIWSIEAFIFCVIVGVSLGLMLWLMPLLKDGLDGPGCIYDPTSIIRQGGKASIILYIIAMSLFVFPFIFFITTWFIGIHGVSRARGTHYFIWVSLGISFLVFLVAFIFTMLVVADYRSFPHF